MHSTNVFNEWSVKITAGIFSEKKKKPTAVCNPVYFQLRIDLMHILQPVTEQRYDGFHHPWHAECPSLSLICTYTLHSLPKHQPMLFESLHFSLHS